MKVSITPKTWREDNLPTEFIAMFITEFELEEATYNRSNDNSSNFSYNKLLIAYYKVWLLRFCYPYIIHWVSAYSRLYTEALKKAL